MQLPTSLREALLEEIEGYLDAVDDPDAETVVTYVMEQLELAQDEHDIEDIVNQIEESAGLDSPLVDALEEAYTSGEEFVFTAEECVSAFEQLCGIEWVDDDEFADTL
jgi:hypothetical protein